MSGPMSGVKVVEMGVWVAGPAAGGILADWGADVIKIEPPTLGDPARGFTKMLGGDLPFNPPFEMDNRGKRSIILDVTQEEGLALALELIADADVFITNMRTSAMERLGLDHVSLLEKFPRLIYGAITGYGMKGPDADRAAYDIAAFWARSGIANALTPPGPDAHPPFQRGGMGDHNAGMSLAGAISAALFAREKSGKGQLVATSLLRQGLFTVSFDLAITMRFGVEVQMANRALMGNPTVNNYRDSEGRWFWVVGLEGERHWPALARAAGHPEWIEDERFTTLQARAANADVLIPMLDEIFGSRPLAAWREVFAEEEDFWWAPVQNFTEVLGDPQVEAAGGFVEVPDGEATTLLPATPADFGGAACTPTGMAPGHGQHSDEVLKGLGHSESEIAGLRERGIVA